MNHNELLENPEYVIWDNELRRLCAEAKELDAYIEHRTEQYYNIGLSVKPAFREIIERWGKKTLTCFAWGLYK